MSYRECVSRPPGGRPRLLPRHAGMIRALATTDDVRSKEPPLGFRERLLTLLHNWLACPDPLQQADRIFVLAGRRYRKSYGVNLLRQGWARGILLSTLSGESLDLSRFAELHLPAWPRLLELQSRIPPQGRFFFLDYDGTSWRAESLPVRPLGTLNEIAQLGRWLRQRPDVRSVLIVSSGWHLRRIRMCCRALLPHTVRFSLAAVPADSVARGRIESTRPPEQDDRPIAECSKLLLYRIVLAAYRIALAGRVEGGCRAAPPRALNR